ncbi:MAG: hypothetical protein COA94_06850 [Rickettsiales bacterium]|nr:MAG: hypothetical protein COA94_06850 [Rickettsiales bacterium]
MGENFVYLFYIKTSRNKEYYLTSSSEVVVSAGVKYQPYSGLALTSGKFNDSGQNQVILSGIFEKQGIDKDDDLTGALVKIMYMQGDKGDKGNKDDKAIHFVSYICTQHSKMDLDFEIKCEPETIKYNQPVVQMFSKTCRANFGDDKCKVDMGDYSVLCDVVKVKKNILTCELGDVKSGYFKCGKLVTLGGEVESCSFKIMSHSGNDIEVERGCNFDFAEQKQVTLIPGCDKSFRTCCYSFKNAVNFRGEPAIPEFNFIKN